MFSFRYFCPVKKKLEITNVLESTVTDFFGCSSFVTWGWTH